jgi:hypothetical protein
MGIACPAQNVDPSRHARILGRMLHKLDELGISEDTIDIYSTDNGPHFNSWPDAAITPYRSAKNTNWEGGWRVPIFVRWPGKIKAGLVLNDMAAHPSRPIRAGGRKFEHLLGLGDLPRLSPLWHASARCRANQSLQGVSISPKACRLQSRRGAAPASSGSRKRPPLNRRFCEFVNVRGSIWVKGMVFPRRGRRLTPAMGWGSHYAAMGPRRRQRLSFFF